MTNATYGQPDRNDRNAQTHSANARAAIINDGHIGTTHVLICTGICKVRRVNCPNVINANRLPETIR